MTQPVIVVMVLCLALCSQASAQSGIITTVAGNGTAGCSGDGGPATSAELNAPAGIAVDATGNLFIADTDNKRVRKVSVSGVISTVAGGGALSFSGAGGPATSVWLTGPAGVAVDASGNMFIPDSNNNMVFKVSAAGIITFFAGNGYAGFSGDGGPATSALLYDPRGVAVDSSGNVFILDAANQRIRRVSANGIISTFAGNGNEGFSGDGGQATAASLSFEDASSDMVVDSLGNLFFADASNSRIRKVSASGVITTVTAGNNLYATSGVAVDASGNLFYTDGFQIKKVSASGVITTIAGLPLPGFSGDGGPATTARLGSPCCLALDASGNLFITDVVNNRIRKISAVASTNVKPPSIASSGIVPADSPVNTIQSGEWVSIYGTNLAGSTATWNGNFPTSLGGTSVTINGKAAYLSYVNPTQINLQAPDDTAIGVVPVVVTTMGGTATSTVTLAHFAPSFLLLDSRHAAGIILRSNGSGAYGVGTYDILGPTGNSLGYATVAAKAGDTIELFATGLGPTSPAVPAGQGFSGAASTANPVKVLINNVSVTPTFAGLSGAGLYQINLTVPAGLGSGDLSLVATVGGAQTPVGVVIPAR